MTIRGEIARNIDKLVKESKLPKLEIAEEVGVSVHTIIDYCKGRSIPTIETLKKLCIFFDCTYEDIIGSLD